MSYPGNPSLGREIQERILGTFQQTLDLAERGNRPEALLGCDFILRLDPLFEPARTLHQRLQGDGGPVDTRDLRGSAAAAGTPAAAGDAGAGATAEAFELSDEDAFADFDLEEPGAAGGVSEDHGLDGLDLDLGDPAEAGPATDDEVVRREILARFGRREHAGVLELAREHPGLVSSEPELGAAVETSQSRLEAGPFVQSFVDSARAARREGKDEESRRLLDKARALDPTHPAIQELDAGAPAAAAAVPPSIPAPFDARSIGEELEAEEAPAVSDSERRISELLDEGQAGYDGEEYQTAIDAWSRIFLIDIDHPEATRRIEQARKLKAERERKIEELFHEGISALEAGKPEEARDRFQQVLAMQSSHLAAKEYLDRIDRGDAKPTPAAAEGGMLLPALPEEVVGAGAPALKEEILVPPEPGKAPARRPRPAAAAPKAKEAGRRFLYIGAAVLALVLLAGWFLWTNRDHVFPNAGTEEPLATLPENPIERARKLREEGKTPLALAQLRRVQPGSPHHEEAQALIAEWEAVPGEEAEPALAAEVAARRAGLVEEAEEALSRGQSLLVVERLDAAAALAPLGPEEGALRRRAEADLAPLAFEIDLFRQAEWEMVLPRLWRRHEDDPENEVVRRLIADSYYNLGVRDLQRGDEAAAAEKFREALEVAPEDVMVERALGFAETYQQRPEDLLYRIFIKYLPFR